MITRGRQIPDFALTLWSQDKSPRQIRAILGEHDGSYFHPESIAQFIRKARKAGDPRAIPRRKLPDQPFQAVKPEGGG